MLGFGAKDLGAWGFGGLELRRVFPWRMLFQGLLLNSGLDSAWIDLKDSVLTHLDQAASSIDSTSNSQNNACIRDLVYLRVYGSAAT